MRKLFFVSFACLILLGLSGGVFAAVEKGDQEIALHGSVTVEDTYSSSGASSSSITTLRLGASYGVFLTDAFELGASGRGAASDTGYNSITADGFAKYHFNTSGNVVPYIGGQLGYTYTESGSLWADSVSYGGMLGIKWFIRENASFFTEYNVNVTDISYTGGNTVTNAGLFGLAVYF